MSAGSDRDDWDEHWGRYAESAAHNPAQQMRHRIITRWLRAGAVRGEGMRILDIGSGQGDLLAQVDDVLPQAELAGFELSRKGVEISRRKVPRARIEVVDLFHAPAEAAVFRRWATHAVCSEVLEHVDDPEEFLQASKAFMATGARLIITVPGGPMSAFDRKIGHRRHFTRQSIAAVARNAGFAPEEVVRAGFPFFNLYRLLVIGRGKRLAADVEARPAGQLPGPVVAAMLIFRWLLRASLRDFPFGWQIAARMRAP